MALLSPLHLLCPFPDVFLGCFNSLSQQKSNPLLVLSRPFLTLFELVFCLSSELNQPREGRRAVQIYATASLEQEAVE